MIPIVLLGALIGVGILLLVLAVDRRPLAGPAALTRLDMDRQRFRRETLLTRDDRYAGESMRLRQVGGRIRETLEARGLKVPASVRADLAITGKSVENHIAMSLIGAAVGLLLPIVGASVLTLVGVEVGLVPVWAGLVFAALGAVVPTLRLNQQGGERRRDFRHVVSSFLDLVAMNLSGGRGVPEALESASSISTTWGFAMIRDTLRNARLQGITPWAALGRLGDELQIDELRDLAAALGLVAEDGAKVRESLFARSDSMRQRELADSEGRAQARSQSMLVAQLLLCVGFLLFLIYPAIARVLGGI